MQQSNHISDAPPERTQPPIEFVNSVTVVELTDTIGPQPWHRPFAEALLTGDSTRVHAAIVCAQRAILNRYLELGSEWESRPNEAADLANAVDILKALKRATDRVTL